MGMSNNVIKISVAGDYCPLYNGNDLLGNNGIDILSEYKDEISDADYSILNFETVLKTHLDKKIEKTGPNIYCNENAIQALQECHVSAVTLANNHFKDYGTGAIANTLNKLREKGIDYLGAGENLAEAQKILFQTIKGVEFAFINFCENEWSIASGSEAGCMPLDLVLNYNQIQAAKKSADYIIIIIHGGIEEYPLPSPEMQKNYRFFIDAGADVVINHHQHCFSGYERYNNKLIFYGLGNLFFPSEEKGNENWHEGFLLNLFFDNSKNITFELKPYLQCKNKPGIHFFDKKGAFNNKITKYNSIIESQELLRNEYDRLISSKRKAYLSYLSPIQNKYIKALLWKLHISEPISKNRKKLLLNLIRCESHRDNLINVLEKSIQ